MSESLDFLLSDEFVEFSKKIVDVQSRHKAKQAEIQELFNKGKADLNALVAEAKSLNEEWEKFKEQKATGSKK